MLEHRQLRYFLKVAECGSFRKAAEQLHLTPPALTKSIQNLEQRLNVQLFDRHYGKAEPTFVGKALIEKAKILVQAYSDVENHIAQISELEAGILSVGAGVVAADSIMHQAILRVAAKFPNLEIKLHTDNTQALHHRLSNGDLELYVAYIRGMNRDKDCRYTQLNREDLYLICRAGHPLLSNPELKSAHFRSFPLVSAFLPYAIRLQLKAFFGAEYAVNMPNLTCNSLYFIKKTLQHTDYLTLGTDSLFSDEFQSGEFVKVPIEETFGQTSPFIVHREDRLLSPAAQEVLAVLTNSL